MRPETVPTDVVEKTMAVLTASGVWITEEELRRALAISLPPLLGETWASGANVAARSAVILGAPGDLPEAVKRHNPFVPESQGGSA